MTNSLITRCLTEYHGLPGLPTERMGKVFEFLADELMKDAFPCVQSGRYELFLDAVKLRQRLLEATQQFSENRRFDYESDLAKVERATTVVLQTSSDV